MPIQNNIAILECDHCGVSITTTSDKDVNIMTADFTEDINDAQWHFNEMNIYPIPQLVYRKINDEEIGLTTLNNYMCLCDKCAEQFHSQYTDCIKTFEDFTKEVVKKEDEISVNATDEN